MADLEKTLGENFCQEESKKNISDATEDVWETFKRDCKVYEIYHIDPNKMEYELVNMYDERGEYRVLTTIFSDAQNLRCKEKDDGNLYCIPHDATVVVIETKTRGLGIKRTVYTLENSIEKLSGFLVNYAEREKMVNLLVYAGQEKSSSVFEAVECLRKIIPDIKEFKQPKSNVWLGNYAQKKIWIYPEKTAIELSSADETKKAFEALKKKKFKYFSEIIHFLKKSKIKVTNYPEYYTEVIYNEDVGSVTFNVKRSMNYIFGNEKDEIVYNFMYTFR